MPCPAAHAQNFFAACCVSTLPQHFFASHPPSAALSPRLHSLTSRRAALWSGVSQQAINLDRLAPVCVLPPLAAARLLLESRWTFQLVRSLAHSARAVSLVSRCCIARVHLRALPTQFSLGVSHAEDCRARTAAPCERSGRAGCSAVRCCAVSPCHGASAAPARMTSAQSAQSAPSAPRRARLAERPSPSAPRRAHRAERAAPMLRAPCPTFGSVRLSRVVLGDRDRGAQAGERHSRVHGFGMRSDEICP